MYKITKNIWDFFLNFLHEKPKDFKVKPTVEEKKAKLCFIEIKYAYDSTQKPPNLITVIMKFHLMRISSNT